MAEPVFARDVQPLLATSCDGGGCHSPPPDGTAPQRDIDFTGPASGYVGKKRKGDQDNEIIIVPGDVSKSFLINKLRNRLRDDPATPEVETYGLSCEQPPNRCGDPMPLVGAPLTDAQIKTLENWIAQGSKDP